MIDLSIRIKSPVTWLTKAKELGLREEYVVTPAVLDEEGNEVTPAEMGDRWKHKVHVYELPTVWINPPQYDEEGNQTQTGVAAAGRHFNVRIDNPEVEAEWADLWDETRDEEGNLISRTIAGATKTPSNKGETAWRYRGIEIVDITTVSTPINVWL